MPPRTRRSRGHIEELPSGRFRAIVYAGIDPLTGRQRYLKEAADTYGAAELALTKLQSRVDENRHPKTAMSIGEAITRWLEVAKLEDTTRDRYDDLIRIYIRPRLGDVAAGKLDAEMLESFYARLQRCRELCNGRSRKGHECRR
jgi:integrase